MKILSDEKQSGKVGAVLLEYVLVAPLLLLLLLGALYFGFAVAVRGMVDHAAHEGIELAAVIPEFTELPVQSVNCVSSEHRDEEFCVGYRKVQQKIYDALSSSFIAKDISGGGLAYLTSAPTIDLPPRGATQTSGEAYAAAPITVTVNAALRLKIPWFSNSLWFTANAAGYREVHDSVSYPVPVDCNGNPFGSPDYNSNKCICVAPSFYFEHPDIPKEAINNYLGGWTCRTCPKDAIPVKDAPNPLPPGYKGNSTVGCYCPEKVYCVQKYGPGHTVASSGGPYKNLCRCICHMTLGRNGPYFATDDPTDCQCNQDQPFRGYPKDGPLESVGPNPAETGDACGCMVREKNNPDAAPRPFTLEDCKAAFPKLKDMVTLADSKCGCRCPSRDEKCGDGNNPPGVTAMRNKYGDPQQGCVCTCFRMKLKVPHQADDMYWNEDSRKCECSAGPCPDGQTRNALTCECECDNPPDCTDYGGQIDPNNPCKCSCVCGTEESGLCRSCGHEGGS